MFSLFSYLVSLSLLRPLLSNHHDHETQSVCPIVTNRRDPIATTIFVESWFLYSMVEDQHGYLLGLLGLLCYFSIDWFDLVVFYLGVSLMMGLDLRRVTF